jgi:hypothetical protein
MKKFIFKVLEAYVSIKKNENVTIIPINIINEIIMGNDIGINVELNGFTVYISIFEYENTLYLFYVDLLNKTLYLINPKQNEIQSDFQNFFIKNWIKFCNSVLLLNDKWKIGNFKFDSKKKKITESDIPLLLCFENLQKNQSRCKVDIHSFSMKRKIVLMDIEDNGKGELLIIIFANGC